MNPFQQIGRAITGAFAAATAAIGPGPDPVPSRPVPSIVMPATTPLPRARPEFEVAALAPGVAGGVVAEGDAEEPVDEVALAAATAVTTPVAEEAVQLALAAPQVAPQVAGAAAGPAASPAGVPLPPPRPEQLAALAPEPPPIAPNAPQAARLAVAPPAAAPMPREVAAPEQEIALVDPGEMPLAEELGGIVYPIPVPRPEAVAPGRPLGAVVLPLPVPRPNAGEPLDEAPHAVVVPPPSPAEEHLAALPPAQPPGLIARINRSEPSPACLARLTELGVEFEVKPAISTEVGCGTAQPLLVHSLADGAVRLNPPATLECPVVERLVDWVEEDVQPLASAQFGGQVTSLRVAASYSCRGVNNADAGPLSEHAYANAIDLSAFEIAGKTEVAVVAQDDPESAAAFFLDGIRADACEHFHTVLGPGSDAAHANHFHLDLAPRGRSGESRFCQ